MAIPQPSVRHDWLVALGTDLMHLAYFYLQDRAQAAQIAREVIERNSRRLAALPEQEQTLLLIRAAITLCRARRARGTERPSQPLLRAVMDLPLALREVAVLSYYIGLDTLAIAQVLGQPEAAVQADLQRLRALLAPYVGTTGEMTAAR